MSHARTPHSSIEPTVISTNPLPKPQKDSGNIKIFLYALFALLGLSVVAGRLFWIQVLRGKEFAEQARKQYESQIVLAAERGKIFDTKGQQIATTSEKLSVAADPNMLEDAGRLARELSLLTGKSPRGYLEKIFAAKEKGLSFVWLERAIESPNTHVLDTLRDMGIIRLREPRRSYAYQELASQAIGFTTVDNVGVSGLELMLDSVLRGENGTMILLRDGRGRKRPSPDGAGKLPLHGRSLYLTLNIDIQQVVESELAHGVQRAEAESGTVVAIRPQTGEILAIASYPTFDPNNISSARADLTRIRAITDMYEPGSTFKLITAAAVLDEQKITPNDTVDGKNGEWKIFDQTIRDAHPIGRVPFYQAFEQSSNVAFAAVAQRLSNDKFYKYVRDFGFGIYLGIDLPGEVRGIVKKPFEFDATTKHYIAHGYQLGATPLQIANAYATIANGGVMMKPFIVKEIRDDAGEVVESFSPQRIRKVVSEQTAQQLREMLVGVVERGTAQSAKMHGLQVAGKTGTAQQLVGGTYSKQDYTASFAGFFPANNPQIAMVVMLDKPRRGYYGGEVAAPIFRAIAERVTSSMLIEVPPQIAETIKKDSVSRPTQSSETSSLQSTSQQHSGNSANHSVQQLLVRVPDVRGLSAAEAIDVLRDAGLRAKVFTKGIVVDRQSLPHGQIAERGTEVGLNCYQPQSQSVSLQTGISANISVTNRPDVRGMSLRRALNILQVSKSRVRVLGNPIHSTLVRNQTWETTTRGETVCVLECSSR